MSNVGKRRFKNELSKTHLLEKSTIAVRKNPLVSMIGYYPMNTIQWILYEIRITNWSPSRATHSTF